MRKIWMLAILAGALVAQQPPEIAYEASNPLRLPAGFNLGEAAGVALNSKGHIFVFNRGGHTALYEFDGNGEFVREIGKDLYGFTFAHVVKIDKDDNIWCVDEGSNMVIEFNPEGHVVMVIGRKPEPVEAPPAAGATPPAAGATPPAAGQRRRPPGQRRRPPGQRRRPPGQRRRRGPTSSTGPPTSRGTLRGTGSSATAMGTRGWPRWIRMATG